MIKGQYQNAPTSDGTFKYKCYQNTTQINKKDLTLKEYQVDTPLILEKRTVQNKVIEFLLLKLFSNDTIKQLVDILFKDMCSDAEIYERAYELHYRTKHEPIFQEKQTAPQATRTVSGASASKALPGTTPGRQVNTSQFESEICDYEHDHALNDAVGIWAPSDPPLAIKFGTNMSDYIHVKNILYIEKIKDIVGLILAYCTKNMKYEVLEIIMRGVIFKKQKLRESFMQEILKASEEAEFENALQYYINHNDLTIDRYFHEHHVHWERVYIVSFVDIVNTVIDVDEGWTGPSVDKYIDNQLYRRLFILTNKGLHLFREIPDDLRCHNCTASLFCPYGPEQERCIRFQDIRKLISFPQMPQKLVVIYDAKLRAAGGEPLGSVTQQLTLLIPTFTRCSSILRTLTEILTNNDLKKPAHHAHHGEASKHGHGRKGGHAKNKHKHGKKVKEIEATPPSNKFRQTDTLVQYYLKLLLSQDACFDLEGLKKSDINKLKLMYVTLRRTSLLTRDFFKQHVPYRGKSASSSTDQEESSFFSFLKSDEPPPDIRDAQTITNCTVLFFICDRLFLLKEDLNRWSYLKAQEPNILKAYHKNLLKEIQA